MYKTLCQRCQCLCRSSTSASKAKGLAQPALLCYVEIISARRRLKENGTVCNINFSNEGYLKKRAIASLSSVLTFQRSLAMIRHNRSRTIGAVIVEHYPSTQTEAAWYVLLAARTSNSSQAQVEGIRLRRNVIAWEQ